MLQRLSLQAGLRGRDARLLPGAHLYRQGEVCANCFLVVDGWAALSAVTRDGAVQILDFAVAGHVLGLAVVEAMRHSAYCLTVAHVQVYPRAGLLQAMEQDVRIAKLLLEAAVHNEARAHRRLVYLGLRDARERVAQLLVDLYVRVNGHWPERSGETLILPLTQRHIAQATGLSGEHVNRTLKRLREQGVLHFNKRCLRVLDPQALGAMAGRA